MRMCNVARSVGAPICCAALLWSGECAAQPRTSPNEAGALHAPAYPNYAAGGSFPLGKTPLRLADVDLDGTPDAILAMAGLVTDEVAPYSVRVLSGEGGALLWRFEGDSYTPAGWSSPLHYDAFGLYGVRAADLDGDGHPEIIVGAPRRGIDTNGNGAPDNALGAVDIFSGRTGQRVRTIWGATNQLWFGGALDLVPDVDGDGAPEIVVGSPGYLSGQPPMGGLFLYSGRTGALLRSTNALEIGPAGYGWEVVCIGDASGDGRPDIATTNRGDVYILDAATLTLIRTITLTQAPVSYPTVAGPLTYLAALGDVDGDGLADVLRRADSTGASALSGATGAPIWAFTASQLLFSVTGIADTNGDGAGEAALTEVVWEGDAHYWMVRVLSGRTGALLRTFVTRDWGAPTASPPVDDYFGLGVASADMNDDGVMDVGVWSLAPYEAGVLPSEVRVYFFTTPGCAGEATGDGAVDFLDLNATLSDYGSAGPGFAGDVNADLVVDFVDVNEDLGGYGLACPGN